MLADQTAVQFSQPGLYTKQILNAVENIVGREVLTLILIKAGLPYMMNNYPFDTMLTCISFDKFSSLMQSIEEQLGVKTGRKITYRAGKIAFPIILDRYGKMAGFSRNALAYTPLDRRLSIGLSALIEISNQIGDQSLSLAEDQDRYLIHAERCATCWGRSHAAEPLCDLFVGFLEAGIYWLCDEVNFQVKETACRAMGNDACVFSVSKRIF